MKTSRLTSNVVTGLPSGYRGSGPRLRASLQVRAGPPPPVAPNGRPFKARRSGPVRGVGICICNAEGSSLYIVNGKVVVGYGSTRRPSRAHLLVWNAIGLVILPVVAVSIYLV